MSDLQEPSAELADYLVRWTIEVAATSPEAAAQAARRMHLDPNSTATVFAVMRDHDGEQEVLIDVNRKPRFYHHGRGCVSDNSLKHYVIDRDTGLAVREVASRDLAEAAAATLNHDDQKAAIYVR